MSPFKWNPRARSSAPIASVLTPQGRRSNAMANIDHKEGAYSIQAHASTAFTFWWGSGSKDPNEYFVVSISPKFDPQNPAMQPLLEQSRSRYSLKAGVWFRRSRLFMVAPDSQTPACPLSSRNSTYRPLQNFGATSHGGNQPLRPYLPLMVSLRRQIPLPDVYPLE